MKRFIGNRIVMLTLLFITICAATLDYYLPAMGDDLSFWNFLGLDSYKYPSIKTLKFIAAHILGCNARIFDYMGPAVINLLPRFVAAIVMGGMMGLFFYTMLLSLKLPKNQNYISFTLFFIATTIAVMPWWDCMWLRVCQFNYNWATTFCLLFVYYFFGQRKQFGKFGLFLLFVLGVCSGGSHEQMGLSMCGAFFCSMVFNKRYKILDKFQKVMLSGLLFGALLPFTSPFLWTRIGFETTPYDILRLILNTLPVYIILLLTTMCLSVGKKGRVLLKKSLDSHYMTLFLAASFAAAIAIWSNIPGRTGWFTESCALILLGRFVIISGAHTNKAVGTLAEIAALLFIIAHYSFSIQAKRTAYKQYKEVIELYIASDDGVVYYDYTGRYDFPTITLNNIKGVPDADDSNNRNVIKNVYGKENKTLIIIPSDFASKLPLAGDSLTINGTTVYRNLPADIYFSGDSLMLQHRDSGERIIEKMPGSWLATKLVLDPGDIH